MTTNTPEPTENWQPWSTAIAAVSALEESFPDLRGNREKAVDSARKALSEFDHQRHTFLLLSCLNTDFTGSLIDDLLAVALSTRHTLRVRNLLGRLPYSEARAIVPPAVWKFLEDKAEDGDAYRRIAELLEHLGLHEALQELCRRADDSIDPDVRDVASDFRA